MSKNCHQCSQRKGRRHYFLTSKNRIKMVRICNKCKQIYNLHLLNTTPKTYTRSK